MFFSGDSFHCFIILVSHFFNYFSDSKNGPWQLVLDQTLVDSRKQNDPLPLQRFNFNLVTARFVKFKLLSYYGHGGGLQYFNIKKSENGEGVNHKSLQL